MRIFFLLQYEYIRYWLSYTILQTRPVPFTVHAVVTTSDLEFDVQNIDFGHCTIYEAVKATIHLSNKSILPQKFGFVGTPEVCIIKLLS